MKSTSTTVVCMKSNVETHAEHCRMAEHDNIYYNGGLAAAG